MGEERLGRQERCPGGQPADRAADRCPKASVRRGKTLKLSYVATAAGSAELSLRKGTKTLAATTNMLRKAGRGSLTLRAKVTKKLKPGKYTLRLTFTAPGADRPAVDSIALTVKR